MMRGFKAMSDSFVDLLPKRETAQSAGYDLKARGNAIVYPGEHALINTGITAYMLPDERLEVCSRSGLTLKSGIFVLNAPGIVDADYYPNEIGVILFNTTNEPFSVKRGDRIAQAVFSKFLIVDGDNAQGKRDSGFGHTGI